MAVFAILSLWSVLFWSALLWSTSSSADDSNSIDLRQSGSGTLYITGHVADGPLEFLLDTGAGISTLSRASFLQLDNAVTQQSTRQIGARLANGKIELLDVYTLGDLRLGDCTLDSLEVAVPKRGGRNLLGLNALQASAPFTIQFTPPALNLSHCNDPSRLLATSS